MARISTYNIDPNITADDKWIGTDFNTQYTKNFTPQYLADFFNISNSIGISGQVSFKYYSIFPGGRPDQSITTPSVNPNFSTITSLKIHKNSGSGNYCIDFINYLSGDEILISDTSNADIFGHFKLNSVTQDLSETNFYNLNVTYIGGNGNLQHLKVYSIALYSATVSIPTVGTWGALNYPSWSTGTPFVKMTAAGTFALDTNTYLTSAVTSVDLTMPSAFNVTGNPITTSGTIVVTGAGTVSQYIRGDGTLATFPTVLTPPLETITEGGNTGIAIRGRNPLNYGNIGSNAVDLSYSTGLNSTVGATGLYSFAEGLENTASGTWSHAEGWGSTAAGSASHAEGRFNAATGYGSHAEGVSNASNGLGSHSEGYGNIAQSYAEHSGGAYGTLYTPIDTVGNSPTDRLVNYGNGTSLVRSDAFTIFKNGAVKFFRATLASITNASAGFFIFDSGNSNRPTIYNGTTWKALAYTDDITTGVTSVSATSPITSSGGTTPIISTSMATNKLIGRSTAGTGVMEEITIGTGLTLSGGTLNASAAGVTSVGLTMPSAFSVTNSPITSSGDIAVTGAGLVSQYVRGDGTLANFPTSSGGGASVSYYLNGSVSQGTLGGVAYKEINSVPIIGTGTGFTINADGYIAQFITDVGDPNKLLIPAGNWNFETYFSASSGGGSPSFYIELYKYNGATFTLITSNSATPENITGGTSIDLYFTAIAVPPTTLLATDRLAVRFYVIHSGRTITMHTENSHLSQIITTFSTGLTTLNGLTDQAQYFAVGTGATNFNISSSSNTHTFNLLFNIRRNANNSSNNNINYNGYAVTGSAESSAVWTIKRLTITASGAITVGTATNVAWTNRESATYI